MEYRTTVPDEHGYEDEDDEFDAMSDYIHTLMDRSAAIDIMDTLLILANICEARALLQQPDKPSADWYSQLGTTLRGVLGDTTTSDYALPNSKLENPLLYFPIPEGTH